MAYIKTPKLELDGGMTQVYARRSGPRPFDIMVTLQDRESNEILRIEGDTDKVSALAHALTEAVSTARAAQQDQKSRWSLDFFKEIKA